jgi:hypothetical protein
MKRRGFLQSGLLTLAGLNYSGIKTQAQNRMGKNSWDDTDAPIVPAPRYATVLFDGKDLSQWQSADHEGAAGWKIGAGYVEVVPKAGNIITKENYTDFQLHVEFWLPLMANAKGQQRANSGIYLQGFYEVQVLDSYGLPSKNNDCGAIYETAAPLRNACKKPETWQAYDIAYRAPRFEDDGKLKEAGRVTVFQNNILIHQNQEVSKPTRSFREGDVTKPGPIMLQDHGNAIRYRNIWIIPTTS